MSNHSLEDVIKYLRQNNPHIKSWGEIYYEVKFGNNCTMMI